MEPNELRRKMMGLWKETFHDSEEYVNLIFNACYDPALVEYETAGNDLISALMGIPYEFGGAEGRIRGLYLCGLATKNKFRGKGIMTRLLERINRRAANLGFAFTFLIPSSERLARWYASRGYVGAFHRCPLNYTSVHDFKLEYDNLLDQQKGKVADLKRRLYETLKCQRVSDSTPEEELRQIKEMMIADQNRQLDMEVYHDEKGIDTIIKESLVSGAPIYYCVTPQGNVAAVAFMSPGTHSIIEAKRIYSSDLCSRYRLLEYVKSQHPDQSVRVYVNPMESERRKLAETYGMAKILDLHEILKFQASAHGDLKYSILVNGTENSEIVKYDIRSGKVISKTYDENSEEGKELLSRMSTMSHRDISNVLFRRPDSGVLVAEAFGMPSLGGFISLMLD